MQNLRCNMSTELMVIQQQNEILQLKLDIATQQVKKASKLEDSLFSQSNYQHYYKIAQQFAKSTLIPKNYIGKPDDIFIAMAMGYQLGFSVEQSLQDIAVINGRPCLWGDGLLALVLSHPDLESIQEHQMFDDRGNIIGCRCIIKRRNHPEHTEIFTVDDAKKANLWGKQGPWSQYPTRMLKLRARSFAVRDKFADALRGIKVAEEVQDYDDDINVISNNKPNKSTTATNIVNDLLEKKGFTYDSKPIEDTVKHSNKGQNKSNTAQAEQNNEPPEMGETGGQKTSTNNTIDETPITDELLDEISGLLHDKPMSGERMEKALSYLAVESIEKMNVTQAKRFIKIINTPSKD